MRMVCGCNMGFEESVTVEAVGHVHPTARLRFYTRQVHVTFVVVGPRGRTSKGELFIQNRGLALLFRHQLFGPLSPALLTLVGSS
jgi:hypothetical protein